MRLLSTSEAAAALGVSPRRVLQLIADGRLRAKRIGRDYVIEAKALRAVRDRPNGRPPAR